MGKSYLHLGTHTFHLCFLPLFSLLIIPAASFLGAIPMALESDEEKKEIEKTADLAHAVNGCPT